MRAFGVLLGCVLITACGGGGGGGGNPAPPPPPPTFTIGGTVTGLTGSGLELRNNAGNPLAVTAGGTFTFGGTVASGSGYDVTVSVQPTNPSQACVVAAGTGTAAANVTNVSVTCTNSYPVNVTVDGLFGTGLVLDNNNGNSLTINANGAAAFSTNVASGAAYNVAVRTQPTSTPAQTCTVVAGAGTVGTGPVTGIAVRCRAQAGRFVYVAAAAPNGVAAFTIDATTGALTPIAGSPFATTGRAPRVVFADPLGRFLYVYGDDDITVPGGTTLTGFAVNAQTGVLTAIPGLLVNLNAASPIVVSHPSGNFFYVPVTDGALSANNQLRGFAIDATTGALTELPGFPWGPFGPAEILNSVVLSPNGASLYLASSTPPILPATPRTGTIRQYAVTAQTGALGAAPTSQATDAGASFNQMVMHPAGTHLYTRNTGPTALTSRFTLDVTTGAIGTRTDIATAFGFGVAIAPGGRVYFPEFGGTFAVPGPGSVVGAVDSASGAVTALPSSPYSTGGTNSLAPALDPTGRYLALTNLGSANITVFRIDPAQGSLAHVSGSPYTPSVGTTPGLVTFDPSARFSYLTDGSTTAGSISSYAIDVDTGHPTFVSSQPTGGAPGGVVAILGRQ